MSVRRLAEENVQPEKFAFSRENKAWAKTRIGLYPEGRQQSAVIPLLMRAQEQEGWVSRPAIEEIAQMLDMPYIRVLEVATFYTQFQLQPVGTRAHIQVCGTTPCMLRGAEDIRAVCQSKIHAEPHHLNSDGTLSWEEVECLGACVNAPMVAIGQETYEDLTPERMEEIIDAFAAGNGAAVPTGPQVEREFSAPQGGFTSLTDVPKKHAKSRSTKVANDDAPTQKGRKREVSAEAAPAIDGPKNTAKVSRSRAEKERKTADAEATAIFEAPEGAADDLKLISGVGPVLEKKLNAFGVTQIAQVAKFKKADIQKLDDALSFKGRIERDDWVKQAKALAKGEAEYVRVFGKKPR